MSPTPYTNLGKRNAVTPQSEPIPGKPMVPNNAGGFVFSLDDMAQLRRFLILGSTGGTYYVGERTLTKEHLGVVERLLKGGFGKEVVDTIVEISDSGRAPSNDPALFALARCCACDVHGMVKQVFPARTKVHTFTAEENLPRVTVEGVKRFIQDGEIATKGSCTIVRVGLTCTFSWLERTQLVLHPDDVAIRQYAYDALPKVARIGTHWLHFQDYVQMFRGRGHMHKRASQAWYSDQSIRDVTYQVIKYQQRDGWSHRDILRLARPNPLTIGQAELYHWISKGELAEGTNLYSDDVPLKRLWAVEQIKKATSEKEVAALIKTYRLPREVVPTQHLHSRPVWEALLEAMPMEAMLRNLATMTREGVLKPLGDATCDVIRRLGDEELIRKARLHPIKILAALTTYASGKSIRGDATWTPLQEIIDALNLAFYLSFKYVDSTGKRIILALDVSPSMDGGAVGGIPGLTPRVASAAMALVTAATEQRHAIMAFSSGFIQLPISPGLRLDHVASFTNALPFDRTDCSLPMLWAMVQGIEADAFVIYTDNETWSGNIQPVQALREYRKKFGIAAKLVVVGMTATKFSIADPEDAGMLDVVGFDTAAPQLISSFIKGEF